MHHLAHRTTSLLRLLCQPVLLSKCTTVPPARTSAEPEVPEDCVDAATWPHKSANHLAATGSTFSEMRGGGGGGGGGGESRACCSKVWTSACPPSLALPSLESRHVKWRARLEVSTAAGGTLARRSGVCARQQWRCWLTQRLGQPCQIPAETGTTGIWYCSDEHTQTMHCYCQKMEAPQPSDDHSHLSRLLERSWGPWRCAP